jgi:hypothetical protein
MARRTSGIIGSEVACPVVLVGECRLLVLDAGGRGVEPVSWRHDDGRRALRVLAEQTLFHVIVADCARRDIDARVRLFAEVEHKVYAGYRAHVGNLVGSSVSTTAAAVAAVAAAAAAEIKASVRAETGRNCSKEVSNTAAVLKGQGVRLALAEVNSISAFCAHIVGLSVGHQRKRFLCQSGVNRKPV